MLNGRLSFGGLTDVESVGRVRVGTAREGGGRGFTPLSLSSCSSVSCLGVILMLLNTGGSMIMGFLKQQMLGLGESAAPPLPPRSVSEPVSNVSALAPTDFSELSIFRPTASL